MKPKNNHQLIISLMIDDLRNARLVYGLNALGLQSEDHLLNLGQTIFHLMGFPETIEAEPAFDQYCHLTHQAAHIHYEDSDSLSRLALEIYEELKKLRKGIAINNTSS